MIVAYAFNEPSKLQELLKPSVGETAQRAAADPDAWDQDQWWSGQR